MFIIILFEWDLISSSPFFSQKIFLFSPKISVARCAFSNEISLILECYFISRSCLGIPAAIITST